ASTLVAGAELIELRDIERTLKLRIERRRVNAFEAELPRRSIENTLTTRTLVALPGEVFV
ncbi:MAG: ATP-dependent helicase, partial [Acidobacteria bacterium]